MIDTQKILAIAAREMAGTDLFAVSCSATPSGEVELLIDSDTSVSIDACAGIGSELRTLRQYRKLIGRPVEVLLTNGIKLLATLDAADETGIALSYEEKQAVEGKKRKQTVTVERTYPFDEIKYTKEWLDFK